MVLKFIHLEEVGVFAEGIKDTFGFVGSGSVFELGYVVGRFKLKGNVHTFGDVESATVLERLLIAITNCNVFDVSDAYFVEIDDGNGGIYLFDGIDNSSMNGWSRSYESLFDGVDSSVYIVVYQLFATVAMFVCGI